MFGQRPNRAQGFDRLLKAGRVDKTQALGPVWVSGLLGAVQLSEEQEFRLANCEDTNYRRCRARDMLISKASNCKTLAIEGNRSQAARYACGRRGARVCVQKGVSAVLEVARWRLGKKREQHAARP